MTKPKLFILCGISSSGKSTYAKELAKREDAFIICKDKLREMFYGKYKFVPRNENFIHRISTLLTTESLFKGQNIIIDETNIKKEQRQNWQNLGKIYNAKVYLIEVVTLEKDLVSRRMTNSKGIYYWDWSDIIDKQIKRWQDITKDEAKIYDEYIRIWR